VDAVVPCGRWALRHQIGDPARLSPLRVHNLYVIAIRRSTADDAPFMQEMLAVAVGWRPGSRLGSIAEVMAAPELARYVADWPRMDDIGFVATDGATDVGAVWWRFFPQHDCGYGFVDDQTPELSIGVVHEARRSGVGSLLLRTLIEEALRSGLPALSLSVEPDNPAASLYERLGFEPVPSSGGALTMLLRMRS